MKKVLLPQPIHEAGIKLLEGKTKIIICPDASKKSALRLVKNVHGIILRTSLVVDKDIIDAAKNLQVVSRTGVGVDNIDAKEATKKGILVCNLPGVNTLSVAEHTVSFILALAKQLKFMDKSTRQEQWNNRNSYQAIELKDKLLGLIGVGRIGSQVATICHKAFNIQVVGYDPYVGKSNQIKNGIQFYDRIEEVFEKADFVSVHIPSTPKTHNLITWKLFNKMKKNAYFINTSRGEVVNEKALIKALEEGKIKGAALDVFSKEPPSANNPLLQMENVLFSPHSASLTQECVIRLAKEAVQAVLNVFANKLPKNIFNQKELEKAGFIKEDRFTTKFKNKGDS